MKRILLLVAVIATASMLNAQGSRQANLPGPSRNSQTLPAGSYIIPMDNTWQANDAAKVTDRYFNLKSYGLIVFLLNNNVKVKRVIKSGKAHEGIDFSVSSMRLKPSAEMVPSFRDFKTGPFVISAADLPNNINDLIDYYNNTPSLSGILRPEYKVKVYKTNSPVDVDVRFDLTGFRPKAGIMDDGGNYGIHTNYFELAGIPKTNYAVTIAANLTIKCYTFASEPHNDKVTDDIKAQIRQFVLDGGNFLAQCAAVPTYENKMKFHTDNGIKVTNASVTSVEYPNPDLSYGQIESTYYIRNGGSCQNWTPVDGSAFLNDAHGIAVGKNVIGQTVIGASASKLIDEDKGGGMVFYLGSHSYSSITDYIDINGMRMYMNAFLTPPLEGTEMNYTYKTTFKKLKVNAPSGPTVGYPVKFRLYVDNGFAQGSVDSLDIPIGNASISSAGLPEQDINIPDQYAVNTRYVMVIEPSSDCVTPAQTVQPPTFTPQVLPVNLTYFTAKRNQATVGLNWETAFEQNNKGFVIQSKAGDGEWKDIAFVFSASTGGSSNTPLRYSYNDRNNYQGVTQYRIAQVDLDNMARFSEIRQVAGESLNGSGILVYPNPAKGGRATLLFDNSTERNVYLMNVSGQVMKQWLNNSSNNIQLNQLMPGLYVIRIDEVNTGKSKMEKLIVN